jgi:hypothetical protein
MPRKAIRTRLEEFAHFDFNGAITQLARERARPRISR